MVPCFQELECTKLASRVVFFLQGSLLFGRIQESGLLFRPNEILKWGPFFVLLIG